MKLEAFSVDEKSKKMQRNNSPLVIFGIILFLIGITLAIYQSYAIFKLNEIHNFINTEIGNFNAVFCESCGTLKTVDGDFFGITALNNINEVVFTDTNEVPVGVVASHDVSAAGDESVMAWVENLPTGGVRITIGADGGVRANPDSHSLFAGLESLSRLDLTHFYTHEATDMSNMFYRTGFNNSNFTLELGPNFDTSNVTDMSTMFSWIGFANASFILDLGDKFDTSNVINMASMFYAIGYSNPSFTHDLGDKFNTAKVTNMNSMFYRAGYNSSLFTLDLGPNFDTSNVTDMSSMFFRTGYNNPNFVLNMKVVSFRVGSIRTDMFGTINPGSTIYAKDSTAKNMISSGTGLPLGVVVIDCSLNSCP